MSRPSRARPAKTTPPAGARDIGRTWPSSAAQSPSPSTTRRDPDTFRAVPEESSDDAMTYGDAARLLGLTADGVAKRVASGRLGTAGARRVDRQQVEAERADLLARLGATDARGRDPAGSDAEQLRRLRARVAALDEETHAAYRDAVQARRERDAAARLADGYLAALGALTDAQRDLAGQRADPRPGPVQGQPGPPR